jgi:hypothetical protein
MAWVHFASAEIVLENTVSARGVGCRIWGE